MTKTFEVRPGDPGTPPGEGAASLTDDYGFLDELRSAPKNHIRGVSNGRCLAWSKSFDELFLKMVSVLLLGSLMLSTTCVFYLQAHTEKVLQSKERLHDIPSVRVSANGLPHPILKHSPNEGTPL